MAVKPEHKVNTQQKRNQLRSHQRKWIWDNSLAHVFQHSLLSIQKQIEMHHLNLIGSHIHAPKGREEVAHQGRKKANCPSASNQVLPSATSCHYFICLTRNCDSLSLD